MGGGVEDDYIGIGFAVDGEVDIEVDKKFDVDNEVEVEVDMTFDVSVEVDDVVAGMYALRYRVAAVWIARDRTEQSRAEQSRAEQSRAEQSRAEQSNADDDDICSRMLTIQSPSSSLHRN